MTDKGIEEVYKVIFEVLEKNTRIERMICEIAGKLEISIVLVDSYGHIMAKSFKESSPDDGREIEKETWIPLMEMYYGAQSENGYVLNSTSSGYQIMNPIVVKDNVEGFCITYHDECSEKASMIEVNDLIARMVAVRFKWGGKIEHLDESAAKQIISRMLLGDDDEETLPQLDERLYESYVLEPFVLMIIEQQNHTVVQKQKLRRKINDSFENILTYVEENMLLVLVMDVRTKECQEKVKCCMQNIVQESGVVAAISDRFQGVKEITTKRTILQRIMKIGKQLETDKHLFKEYDYYLELICSYAYDEIGFRGYCDEELNLLEKEDIEKGTEFFKSLKEYLLCGNNVNIAAKKIFVHRNTMVYRLGKIQEIMKIDINDPYVSKRLLISMILRTLHPKI